jgi:hydrogenase maturation protease
VGRGVRVIGVGNTSRGDDGVGPAVATAVAASAPAVDVMVSTADPSRLIERWESAETVVLVDAMVGGSAPDRIAVFDATDEPLPADFDAISSHGFGVPAAVELARSLGKLPDHLVVIGVTGYDFEGIGLSPIVEDAVGDAVQAVMEVVENA